MLQALLQNVRNEIENRNNKIIIIIYVEVDILSCRIVVKSTFTECSS